MYHKFDYKLQKLTFITSPGGLKKKKQTSGT